MLFTTSPNGLFPRRSDQFLQTDNFKRSGVTGASLTGGTHVLPLALPGLFPGRARIYVRKLAVKWRSRYDGPGASAGPGRRIATVSSTENLLVRGGLPTPKPLSPGLLAPGPYSLKVPDVL